MPYIPAPGELPGFPDCFPMRDGLNRRTSVVEVHDRRGRHLGEFDSVTGERRKGARSDTTVRAVSNIITHRLVGYERTGGRVAVEYDVPDRLLEFAKRIAKVGPGDPQAVLCYRLGRRQARDLAGAIGGKIEGGELNFYFEGFADEASARR